MSIEFDSHDDWNAFWFGEEFCEMRAATLSWYQVPLVYTWSDLITSGELVADAAAGHT
jgi:hypothetical protein